MSPLSQNDCIVIVTITTVEAQAVLHEFSPGNSLEREYIGNHIYYSLGVHGKVQIYMAQSEMGSVTRGGSLMTVSEVIEDLKPQAIIMCGIAFGLRKEKQTLGDILIAEKLGVYEPQKLDINKGELDRGELVKSSTRLLKFCRSGVLDWQGPICHFGLILTGEKLVNHPSFRDELLARYPEAIGGEMEGAGLYSAACDAKVDWILVKAICDWADGTKDDKSQEVAARNAARFVFHLVQNVGGWKAATRSKRSPALSKASVNENHVEAQLKEQHTDARRSQNLSLPIRKVAENMVNDILIDKLDDVRQAIQMWETDENGKLYRELTAQLVRVIQSSQYSAVERSRAGNALSKLGDPRFRSDAWFLPDEELLGFVKIAAGPFNMGSGLRERKDPGEFQQSEAEVPTFYIARYPVTVAQYQAFHFDTKPLERFDLAKNTFSNHPVVNLTWDQAMEYCSWLNGRLRSWTKTPKMIRGLLNGEESHSLWHITLPSELEWEKAARGMNDIRDFPWGMSINPERANYKLSGFATTTSVGCYGKGIGDSPYGVLDMSGNVWEWTLSDLGHSASKSNLAYQKVMKGGSFYSSPEELFCSFRIAELPNRNFIHVGFRIALSQERN
jgi:formylglycine-generating enzyme required for sulfatase activity/nucleoside phosphorylase